MYDRKTTKIIISEKAVISGYRTEYGLWRIPLNKYGKFFIQQPSPNKSIYQVFELPSTEKTVAYYHAAAGFPTKETWTDTIWAGNYDTWPGLAVKAVNKYFPESDETQIVHMKSQAQGLCSTKPTESKPALVVQKKQDETFVKVVHLKEIMYSDQTGKFMYLSMKGMWYIMIAYHNNAE